MQLYQNVVTVLITTSISLQHCLFYMFWSPLTAMTDRPSLSHCIISISARILKTLGERRIHSFHSCQSCLISCLLSLSDASSRCSSQAPSGLLWRSHLQGRKPRAFVPGGGLFLLSRVLRHHRRLFLPLLHGSPLRLLLHSGEVPWKQQGPPDRESACPSQRHVTARRRLFGSVGGLRGDDASLSVIGRTLWWRRCFPSCGSSRRALGRKACRTWKQPPIQRGSSPSSQRVTSRRTAAVRATSPRSPDSTRLWSVPHLCVFASVILQLSFGVSAGANTFTFTDTYKRNPPKTE